MVTIKGCAVTLLFHTLPKLLAMALVHGVLHLEFGCKTLFVGDRLCKCTGVPT